MSFPEVQLSELLQQHKDYIEEPEPIIYRKLSVKLYGKGVALDSPVDGTTLKMKRHQIARAGQVILSEIWGKKGAIGFVPDDGEGALCTSHYFLFDTNSKKLDKRWLDWIFRGNYLEPQLAGKAFGTTGYAAVRPQNLLDATIPLPSLDEQRRFVTKIVSLASQIKEAKQLRQSIQTDMDSLLVAMAHRNDLSDDEKQAQGWKRTALGDVLAQVVDPVKVEPGQEYPHFGIYSFAKGLFSKPPLIGGEIKASNLYRVREGQFIYGRLNAYEGAFAIIGRQYDQHYVSNEFPIFSCAPDRVLPEFLLAYFSTPAVWEALKRKVTGIGGGAGNRRIRLKESLFLADVIWLPPMAWQQKIKQTGNWLANIRQTYADTQPELDALLPSILDRAFKGEL